MSTKSEGISSLLTEGYATKGWIFLQNAILWIFMWERSWRWNTLPNCQKRKFDYSWMMIYITMVTHTQTRSKQVGPVQGMGL